jgi:hypothetical protein
MKSSQEKIPLTFLGVMLASLLILGGCSDTSMPSQNDQVVTIPVITVPSSAEALAVVISGSVIDQSTGNIVDNAIVSFFEGASAATNIFDTNGDAITSPLSVSGGSFQVSAENNITSFSVDVSAVDYLDSSLDINFAADDNTVVFQIALIPEAAKSVAVTVQEKTVNPQQLIDAVEVSTEAGGQDDPVGSAELVIDQGTELQDAQGNPVSGSTLSVEVTYVESQEAGASDDGEAISIANVIPEGLNGNTQGADVLIPVGIAEINMSVGDAEVKKFSQAITVTINLPKETIFPSTGQEIEEGNQFTVRSYDEDTKLWTTEDSLATVGDLDGDVYPANFEVDHLTFFALADPVAACVSDVTFTFSGDQIPDNSLIMSLQSDEIYQSELLSSVDANGAVLSATADKFLPLSENTAEPGAASKELGLAANAAATVTVKDLSGNVWYQSQPNISICGQTIDVELDNPVETVSENLDISLVCSNDSLVFNELQNAVVSYRQDNNSVSVLATEGAAGSYALTGLDLSAAEYSVTVDTRTSAGVQTTTIVPDGTDETLEVSIPCSVATGTGTGSS